MIPIACEITDFSLYLFVYYFENIIILVGKFEHTALQGRMTGARLKD